MGAREVRRWPSGLALGVTPDSRSGLRVLCRAGTDRLKVDTGRALLRDLAIRVILVDVNEWVTPGVTARSDYPGLLRFGPDRSSSLNLYEY